jgi:hypothetical protein
LKDFSYTAENNALISPATTRRSQKYSQISHFIVPNPTTNQNVWKISDLSEDLNDIRSESCNFITCKDMEQKMETNVVYRM